MTGKGFFLQTIIRIIKIYEEAAEMTLEDSRGDGFFNSRQSMIIHDPKLKV